MNNQAIVYRLEWKGKGPFFEEKIFKEIVRECRKITPEWKFLDIPTSSWVEYYCAAASSPYDNPAMSYALDKGVEGFAFGFTSLEALTEATGIDHQLFKKQMQKLLEQKSLVLRALLVNVYAETDTEIMFYYKTAEVIENIYKLDFC